MRQYTKIRFLSLLVLITSLALTKIHISATPSANGSGELSGKIIKRWNEGAVCQLFWAGGLAAVADTGYKIVRLGDDGQIKTVLDTNWMVRPESIQCKDAVVMGQFFSKSKDLTNKDTYRGFPGLINLRTGKEVELISGDKALFLMNTRAYMAHFWSADYKRFLGRISRDTLANLPEKELLGTGNGMGKEAGIVRPVFAECDGVEPREWRISIILDMVGRHYQDWILGVDKSPRGVVSDWRP